MTAATLRHNGNATATAIDGDGRCNGNAMATTAMERSSDGGGVLTSDGRHLGMLLHYGRASVHLELSSFGYKYSAPPIVTVDVVLVAIAVAPAVVVRTPSRRVQEGPPDQVG